MNDNVKDVIVLGIIALTLLAFVIGINVLSNSKQIHMSKNTENIVCVKKLKDSL